jgi:hypothetical protein
MNYRSRSNMANVIKIMVLVDFQAQMRRNRTQITDVVKIPAISISQFPLHISDLYSDWISPPQQI